MVRTNRRRESATRRPNRDEAAARTELALNFSGEIRPVVSLLRLVNTDRTQTTVEPSPRSKPRADRRVSIRFPATATQARVQSVNRDEKRLACHLFETPEPIVFFQRGGLAGSIGSLESKRR
jgi:hypothetical protein